MSLQPAPCTCPVSALPPGLNLNRSRRFIAALLELPQFAPFSPSEDNWYAVHVLSGAHVYPLESLHNDGMLLIRFSGAMPGVEVCGRQYLRLQVCEAAAHLRHCPENGQGAFGDAARDLMSRLCRAHALG